MVHISRRDFITTAFGLGANLLTHRATAQGGVALTREPYRMRGEINTGLQATITSIRTSDPRVALTFDDGPHPSLTPQLLDILADRNVKATFYVVGRAVAHSPQIVRRMVEEGHEVGNHSWSHPVLSSWSQVGILQEIDRTNQAVFDAAGVIPRTFRPPYGAFELHQRLSLINDRDMPTVLWSVDPEDWRLPGQQYITNFILSNSTAGSIILTHDIHAPTVKSFPAILDGLIMHGYGFQKISTIAQIN